MTYPDTLSCLNRLDGMHAQEFEFFAAFSPLVEKEVAMATCTHLVNDWLHQERDKLFLLYTHTY